MLTRMDWLMIQQAVSNSDIQPNEARIRLLDKIGTELARTENAGKTNSRTWSAVVPRR